MRTLAIAVGVSLLSTAAAFAGWTQMSGNLAQVSVGSASQMWGVQANQQIWQWNGSGWTQIPGYMVCVSVGADGTVWAVNANQEIFRRDGGNWTKVPGSLVQISVGNAGNVWGVDASDHIFRWNGSAWDQIQGALMYVSAAGDGSVWGVQRNGQVWRRDNNIIWTAIDGAMANVAVGSATNVWAVNGNGQVYQRALSSWTELPGPMKQVSVGADGTVLGVNAEMQLFRWTPDAATASQSGSFSASGRNVMLTSQILRSSTGDYLTNNGFVLMMQTDGNLCEYVGTSPASHQSSPMWCSNTSGTGGKFSVQVHSTNNFCVTTGDEWGQGPALWCTNQVGSGSGPAFAKLGDDGIFAIRQGTPSAPGTLLWENRGLFSQVAIAPPANGSIRWPDGTACPGECSKVLPVGSSVALTAIPEPKAVLLGWAGACSGTANPCRLTVATGGKQTVTASIGRGVIVGMPNVPAYLGWGSFDAGRPKELLIFGYPTPEGAVWIFDDGLIRLFSDPSLCVAERRSSDQDRAVIGKTCDRNDATLTGWSYESDRTIRKQSSPNSCLTYGRNADNVLVPIFDRTQACTGNPYSEKWVLASPLW